MGATPTGLHSVRNGLAQEFQEILKEKEILVDKDGNPIRDENGKLIRKRLSPAMFNVIRQFLKDNGIDREPLDGSYSRPAVVNELPFQEPTLIDGTPQHLREAVDANDSGE